MTNLNKNELTVLKAVADNALDAAGGDFAFSDEIHDYLKGNFSKHEVAGYLSQLQSKGYICIDDHDGQIEFWDKTALKALIVAGLIDTNYAEEFNCYHL